MAHCWVGAMAMLTLFAACGADQALEAPSDAPPGATRSMMCAYAGTSMATGSGPDGSLDTSHVYAVALTGFCMDELDLIVTTDDPLATPYLDHSGLIRARAPSGSLGGTAEWSGTLAATISRPDGTAAVDGTLQVERAPPGTGSPTQLRATARFNRGSWQLTATIDAPYCKVVECI